MGAESGSTGSDQTGGSDKSNSETGLVADRGPTGSVSGTASAGEASQSGTSATRGSGPTGASAIGSQVPRGQLDLMSLRVKLELLLI